MSLTKRQLHHAAWLPWGRLGKTHGVRGALKFYADLPLDAVHWQKASLSLRHVKQPELISPIVSIRFIGDALLLQLEAFRCCEEAHLYQGAAVFIESHRIPTPHDGEYYLYELLGAKVMDEVGRYLGICQGMLDNAGQDLLRIDNHEGEQLLPMLSLTLKSFDRTQKTMVVRVPEALAEWFKEEPPFVNHQE